VRFDPAVTVAGPLFAIDKSACAITIVVAVDELLAAFVSKLSVLTVAVLLTAPTLPTATVSVNCALAPELSSGILHATVPPPLHIAGGPLF
jgi:hypothetical protein